MIEEMKTMKETLILSLSEKIFLLALFLVLMTSFIGCEQNHGINSCPVFPEPKREVADELKANCYPDDKCPATWEWLDRLYKLKDQLDVS